MLLMVEVENKNEKDYFPRNIPKTFSRYCCNILPKLTSEAEW